MKKLSLVFAFVAAAALTSQAQVDSTAKKVGNKTAEIASKGKSGVVDQVFKGKMGPDNQTPIYIDHSSKYYYVDAKGKKVYVKKSELKDKPKD